MRARLRIVTLAKDAAHEASAAVYDRSNADPALKGMGTTLTGLHYRDGQMQLVHVGDSRAYRFRAGRIAQLTTDHSWVAEQLSAGTMTEDEARSSEFKHIITRSIGFERHVEVDSELIDVVENDVFLVCSDGLSNYIEKEELEMLMSQTEVSELPNVLIDMANARGGDDNITVVICQAKES